MKRSAVALLLLTAVLLCACPRPTVIWLSAGSTRDSLVFLISDRFNGSRSIAVGSIVVKPCYGPDTPMWRVGDTQGSSTPIHEVRYGTPPALFEEEAPARPLKVGCYRAMAGPGVVKFDIIPDGRAVTTFVNK